MNSKISQYFLISLIIVVVVLAIFIFLPFMTPIVLAAALSVIFKPVHRWIQRVFFPNKERSSFAALISVILIVVIVLIPLLLIAGSIYSEVQNMYSYLTDESGRSQFISMLNNFSEAGSKLFLNMYTPQSFDTFNITKVLSKGLEWVFSNIDVVFGGASKIMLNVFIMFLALFYFLRDGRELRRQIISISPLMDEQDDRVLKRLEMAVYSIFAGSLAVAIIQGVLTGIGFYVFGVPSPTLWGATASISALIPGVGTSLVLGPGIIYLFLIGAKSQAIGLLIWSVFAVGLIDNFLQPVLVNKGVKIHPFIILVSVLGGLSFFGIVGFVLGPIILAFLFALLEIYKSGQKPTISHNI